jgi:hypothetical protein
MVWIFSQLLKTSESQTVPKRRRNEIMEEEVEAEVRKVAPKASFVSRIRMTPELIYYHFHYGIWKPVNKTPAHIATVKKSTVANASKFSEHQQHFLPWGGFSNSWIE